MKRREFIAGLGGAAAWPVVARAQPSTLHRIGYLSLGSPAAEAARSDAFHSSLAALGYIAGKNLAIETRWLDGRNYDQLPNLAADLVDLNVEVIVTYSTPGVTAAQRATSTIPIVFTSLGDAVASGVVSSLARPGGNVTGTSYFLPELSAKRLELIKDAAPALARIGVLFNPANRSTEPVLAAIENAGRSLKVDLVNFAISAPADLDGALAAMSGHDVGAFVVTEDPMLIYQSASIAKLAVKYRLGACGFPELAQLGGLAAYGIDFVELWRHAATFVAKILNGTKPVDLPVEQATKFVTIINLNTANALGLTIPATLLARADEVIE